HGEVDKVVSLLTKKGANAAKLDGEGKSALHVAAARGLTECLAVMLAHGADLSVTDAAGMYCSHTLHSCNCKRKLLERIHIIISIILCTVGGSFQIVQLLCELKTPINQIDTDGLTPLMLSAKHSHPEVCSTLIDCGAEINTPDNCGRTALMLAAESNAVAAVEVLAQKGADLSAVDSEGHDVVHYIKMLGSSEAQTALLAALNRHPLLAKLSDERITTPKKRKAPPPPNSPLQVNACLSVHFFHLSVPLLCHNPSLLSPPLIAKEDEFTGFPLKEVEKLHEERNMLLETIKDLKQTVETVTVPQLEHTASAALVSALQARITSLTLENQELANKLKRLPSLPGNELKENSRPNSMASNSSFHSTQDEFHSPAQVASTTQVEEGEHPVKLQEEGGEGGSKEEIGILKQALESLQIKLIETKKEYSELQKLEVEKLEHEIKQLKVRLVQLESEKDETAQRIRLMEEALQRTEEERRTAKEKEQRSAQIEELYKEAQEEVRMLQEALKGTVPVEAAAKDFEEMKSDLNEVIAGQQQRLLELSHSYSETKSQLIAAQKELAEAHAEKPSASAVSSEQQVQMLSSKVEELQTLLAETEGKLSAAQEDITRLRQEAEAQTQSSVTLTDHTQVVSSLGNAIKELESDLETLREQLHQKTTQVEAFPKRLNAEQDVTSEDAVPRLDHEAMREQLEGEVNHLTQLLQAALRKQDEMALEAADAWQKVARDNRAEREALQELLMSREKENQTLTSKLAEAQDAVCQLKQLVENHVASEREKNKRIDDLSREVGKLKEALNSLSQLSYTSCSPSKRQQQNQQMETLQQQLKQLQYQLAESKKQHDEIVSVYRMHLLYAVQGQMDEDVQKALKQILKMCKVPSQAKEAC
uniref:Uncharacterized protein n=1 Tax=Xiphophorus couchianus TaxID=32473 RepID=A0A3B5L745_9TELE